MLQVGYEAWIDTGLELAHLRGSNRVGVYVGACASDAFNIWLSDIPNITGQSTSDWTFATSFLLTCHSYVNLSQLR